ncbi:uncharacterized protein si:ch211-119e14.1 [Micropterus salmoides]|uniref:uncharacterized protein si:ch211-119e14.1 n=1 Tax=Micropterus salmoides TaxID=27706 RepID=UPI0018EC8D2B|nr:uncharacterized protein si:ch211-119e14.1 [Micropterus salmoides]
MAGESKSSQTVLILSFCLLGLIVLLIFFYKKLNKEADGEYTVRRMVYKEGGVRDRVRGAALALGTRVGVQLWPHSDVDEDGEEMQEVQDEEGQVEEGSSEQSDSEEDDQEEEEEEEEGEEEGGEEEDNVELVGKTEGNDSDTSENPPNSSLEAGEQTRLTDQPEAKGGTGDEKVVDGEGKGEASGGTGLLIDLKQFSGSAIWSDEGGSKDVVVTAL